MDSCNMEDSELHTLEQLDESEVLQASRDPFKDNNTVCKCRGRVCERGVEMHVLAKILGSFVHLRAIKVRSLQLA